MESLSSGRRLFLFGCHSAIVRQVITVGSDSYLHFTATLRPDRRFGVTIHTTGVGLLVTYVDPNGAGSRQNVLRGDLLFAKDGVEIPLGTFDGDFATEVQTAGRPVVLSFSRHVATNPGSLEELLQLSGPI